jgi:hypothetical protein
MTLRSLKDSPDSGYRRPGRISPKIAPEAHFRAYHWSLGLGITISASNTVNVVSPILIR